MTFNYENLSVKTELINGQKFYSFISLHDFVALDIETTGLSPLYNEIINIGAIRFRNNRPVEQFDVLVKPFSSIPREITRLTGITNAMVQDAPPIKVVLPQFIEFLGEDIILGHNVRFDISFINNAMLKYGFDNFITTYVDTMLIARRFRKHNSLENLVRDYVNSNYVEQHTGLDDALNTARVFYRFKQMLAGPL